MSSAIVIILFPITDFMRHNGIHTGEKPYQCRYCYKIFTNYGNILIHVRTHTQETNLVNALVVTRLFK